MAAMQRNLISFMTLALSYLITSCIGSGVISLETPTPSNFYFNTSSSSLSFGAIPLFCRHSINVSLINPTNNSIQIDKYHVNDTHSFQIDEGNMHYRLNEHSSINFSIVDDMIQEENQNEKKLLFYYTMSMSFMSLFVPFHGLSVSESFLANIALEWLLACMHADMFSQSVFLPESTRTMRTWEWLLASVDADVLVQITFLNESLLAMRAREWLLASMGADVRL